MFLAPCPVKQTTSQNLWSQINLFINRWITLRFQKRDFISKSWKRDISSVLERAFSGFLGDFLLLLNFLKRRGVSMHKNSLASCHLVNRWRLVKASSLVLWRVLSNKVIRVLVTVELTPHTYTLMFFQSYLLSTLTVTLSDSVSVRIRTTSSRWSSLVSSHS